MKTDRYSEIAPFVEVVLILLIFVLFFINGCFRGQVRKTPETLTRWQESHLGEKVATGLSEKYTPTGKESAEKNLEKTVDKIAKIANQQDWQWRVRYLETGNRANMFVLPRGNVYITREMIQSTRSEDELAFIFAHTAAHIIAGHGRERIGWIYEEMFPGKSFRKAVKEAGGSVLLAYKLAYGALCSEKKCYPFADSREIEADRIGVIYMFRAGYDPEAAVAFLKRIQREKNNSIFSPFADIHPVTNGRVNHIREFIPRLVKHYGK
jgi:predicted Zn-dependent protease